MLIFLGCISSGYTPTPRVTCTVAHCPMLYFFIYFHIYSLSGASKSTLTVSVSVSMSLCVVNGLVIGEVVLSELFRFTFGLRCSFKLMEIRQPIFLKVRRSMYIDGFGKLVDLDGKSILLPEMPYNRRAWSRVLRWQAKLHYHQMVHLQRIRRTFKKTKKNILLRQKYSSTNQIEPIY